MCSGKRSLQVNNEQEALFIACEMERRAIRVYERGLMLDQAPAIRAMLEKLCNDEKGHLLKFSKLGNTSLEASQQELQLVLASYAGQVLFPGGLMQAQREGAFKDVTALLQYARDNEEIAVQCYLEFAEACERQEAREMFLIISKEEKAHLLALEEQLKKRA